MSFRFKSKELQHFNWIFGNAPCFPVHSSKISIITEPNKFYETLYEKFKDAKRRISIASLYIGTGELEKDLLKVMMTNAKQQQLSLKILLDYQRGTRGEVNSKTLFESFIDKESIDNCKLSLYQTPKLQGSWSKALPSRYNEIIGLQHMKLYIADDIVILSGANCSNDYFGQRQDRYIQIEDKDLVNFYCDVIDALSDISKQLAGDKIVAPKEICRKEFEGRITDLIEKWKLLQAEKLSVLDSKNETNTWIFPLLQMGDFNITQDEDTTCNILTSGLKGSYFRLATGYFNLTEKYEKVLLKDCKANISLLMAHPNANGFLGASGPAGGIPYAYSLIAKKFWQKVVDYNQISRVRILEYERPGWTFHAKGLWYYPPGSEVPWACVVGSANLGERSVRRDLEAQAAIFTESPDLQKKLHEECTKLHDYSTESIEDILQRNIPLWVQATVGLFRTYF
ncbi:CDP-diacylglycerol--glycerol-3-phosphate 3-phosphatidyltransferase, mitochondrial isoform X2 [Aricia agestis]|uniref:CDP-diacylglycerol--glycerol-3-phosphate 3-phosphatidyltransferase, mitochondrial isoform X2 n=1 Tax=Aricia agestis TaxID=91739 RepID=UPI001C207513|nr:CDP-diacylglycerol--glycerol-3-phosphate 3-phosphatidyltransferase, mitochondrial isoform X2 [Aricia agestis]